MAAPSPRASASRRRLLAAAGELIPQHGYHATSVAQVGAAANLSRGAVTVHFGTKAAMFQALVDDVVRRWQQLLSPAAGLTLDDALTATWDRLDSDPGLLATSLGLLHAALGPAPAIMPRVQHELRRLRQSIAQRVHEDQRAGRANPAAEPQAIAALITAALTAAAMQHLTDGSQAAAGAYAETRAALGARLSGAAVQR